MTQRDDLPLGQQCTLPGCERPAVDPERPGDLCAECKPDETLRETGTNPGCDTGEPTDAGPMSAADYITTESGVYSDRLEWEQWMGRVGKRPFSPWGDRDHPEADVDEDARWKWSITDNYADAEIVAMAEDDPRLDGRVFIQREDDPFAFVDGDDVRCPESGKVHPEFVTILDALGATYADVSTSGSGVHAIYRGELPERGAGQVVFDLDTDPWGENDDPPTVEIYANKHVCVATGEHVPGTPTDAREWDADALLDVLDEHDAQKEPEPDHDTDRDRADLDDHDPDATGGDETAENFNDVLYAVNRLRPSDFSLRTRQVGTDGTGWEKWDPSTYRISSGNDSLHKPPDEAVFHDFKHGESFGVLGLFAAEKGIINKPWDCLRGADWRDAVDAAREAGAPIPEYDAGDDVEHVATLPDVEATPAGGTWNWRQGAEQTAREDAGRLTRSDAQDQAQDVIRSAYNRMDTVLVDALPSVGKSYGAIEAAADTDTPITFLTRRGHEEQYGQIEEWCEQHGLTCARLPSFKEDCPTANGEFDTDDEEWTARVWSWYNAGATPQQIHKCAETALGRPLPCKAHKGQDCPFSAKWRALDPDETDVLIGHYTHAHIQSATEGRTVVVDEFPGDSYQSTPGREFGQLSDGDDAGAMPTRDELITAFLERHDGLPFEDCADLMENRDDQQRRADAFLWFEEHGVDRNGVAAIEDERGHADAPLVVFTLLAADDLGNGRERADLGDGRTGVYNRRTGAVTIHSPPDLRYARNVVALDGTPTLEMWDLAMGVRFNRRQVLSDREREEYIRDAMDLNFVRTTDAIKPYNSADHVAVEQDRALLEAIAEEHGERPGLITTSTALDEYDAAGVLNAVDGRKYYGNVLGSNEYKHRRLGAVIGSNHYGDQYIKLWGALAGKAIERGGEKGRGLSYGAFGDRVLTHMREHETLQAAMRFGRDGKGAVVYVHTDTLPGWVPIAGEGRVVKTWSDGQRQVIDALGEQGVATTADLADHPAVDVSERQVREHLHDLAERGYVDVDTKGCGYVWRDDGLHRVGEHADVELDPVDLDELSDAESAEVVRSSIYTWSFRTSHDAPPHTPPDATAAETPAPADAADSSHRDGPPPG